MRVTLCSLGVVIGGILFASGIIGSNHGMVLVGLILLPLSFVLGTIPSGEHEPMAASHDSAPPPRTAYEDSLRGPA